MYYESSEDESQSIASTLKDPKTCTERDLDKPCPSPKKVPELVQILDEVRPVLETSAFTATCKINGSMHMSEDYLRAVLSEVLDGKLDNFRKCLVEDLENLRARHVLPAPMAKDWAKEKTEKTVKSYDLEKRSSGTHVLLDTSDSLTPSGTLKGAASFQRKSSRSFAESSSIQSIGISPPRRAFTGGLYSDKKSAERSSGTRRGVRALTGGRHASTRIQQMVDKMTVRQDLSAMRKQENRPYDQRVLDRLISITRWWNNLKEPHRTGRLASLVKNRWFEFLCINVIFVNSVFLAFGADWEIRHPKEQIPMIFVIAEAACSIFFIIELSLRMAVHRVYYFVNNEMKMNIFDFTIVLLAAIDLVVFFIMEADDKNTNASNDNEGGNGNLVLMRMFRLLKLAKMFRTVRALRFFKDLVVIFEGVKNSLVALFWIFIMLGMLLYVFSLVFLQGVIDYVRDQDTMSESEAAIIERYFGTMWNSMLSLYCAVTGGDDWRMYYEIIAKTGPIYASMFVMFTFFFLFAMFNILTGLFVEKAAVAARPDADEIVMSQKRKAEEHANEFRQMCLLLDEDQSGHISWQEFARMMSNPTLVAYMASIGLEVHEPELFYAMICDCGAGGATEVSIDNFVDRCMQMKGLATSIDSQRHLYELHSMRRELQSFTRHIESRVFAAAMERAECRVSRSMDSQAVRAMERVENVMNVKAQEPIFEVDTTVDLDTNNTSENKLSL